MAGELVPFWPAAHEDGTVEVVTPDPPEVATGTVTQGCRVPGACDWTLDTAAGRGALAAAWAK